jgi:hypothetical protein
MHKAELEEAIQRLARAKDRSESLFSRLHRKVEGRNDQEELEAASQNLKEVFARYTTAVAGVVQEQTGPMIRDMDALAKTVLKDPANPDAGFADGVDPKLIDRYKQAESEKNDLESQMTMMIVQEMASARYRVDQAQLEIKMQKPGGKFIAKFREMWTKHPGWRAGIGAALTVGAIAASTVAPPLGLGLFALKRGIATAGTYMGVEGAGRAVTNKRSERSDRKAAEQGLGTLSESSADAAGEAQAAGYEAVRTGGEAGSELVGKERGDLQLFIWENYKDIMLEPNSLKEALRSPDVDAAAVVAKLLDRRITQLESDTKWTRRSKYLAAIGAAIVGSASIMQIKSAIDARPPAPRPSGPSDSDLNKAFFKGIEAHHGPDTAQDWATLQAGGPGKAKLLWEANPAHDATAKAMNGWMDKLSVLSEQDQLNAATLIGYHFDQGTLTESGVDKIVSTLS